MGFLIDYELGMANAILETQEALIIFLNYPDFVQIHHLVFQGLRKNIS